MPQELPVYALGHRHIINANWAVGDPDDLHGIPLTMAQRYIEEKLDHIIGPICAARFGDGKHVISGEEVDQHSIVRCRDEIVAVVHIAEHLDDTGGCTAAFARVWEVVEQ